MAAERRPTIEEQLRSYGAVLHDAAESADESRVEPAMLPRDTDRSVGGRAKRRRTLPAVLVAAGVALVLGMVAVVAVSVDRGHDDVELDVGNRPEAPAVPSEDNEDDLDDLGERPGPVPSPPPDTSSPVTPPTDPPAPSTTTTGVPLPPQHDLANPFLHPSGVLIAYPRTWHFSLLENAAGTYLFGAVPPWRPDFATEGTFAPIHLDVQDWRGPGQDAPPPIPNPSSDVSREWVVTSESWHEVDGRPAFRRERWSPWSSNIIPHWETEWWVDMGPGADGSHRWLTASANDTEVTGTSYQEAVAVLDAMVATIVLP